MAMPINITLANSWFIFSDLRPVEEFRHTPIIPISEKDLFKYKQDVE